MTTATCGMILHPELYTATVTEQLTCVLCERIGSRGFEVYAYVGGRQLWCCSNQEACQRRQEAADAESETWTVTDVAEYLHVATKSADSALRRWTIEPVSRDPGRGGANRYLASQVRREQRISPGKGRVAYRATTQAAAHVAYADHPRPGERRLGAHHAVLDQPLEIGKLRREAGDALCKPADKFYSLERRDHAEVSCPRCRQLAARLLVTIKNDRHQ